MLPYMAYMDPMGMVRGLWWVSICHVQPDFGMMIPNVEQMLHGGCGKHQPISINKVYEFTSTPWMSTWVIFNFSFYNILQYMGIYQPWWAKHCFSILCRLSPTCNWGVSLIRQRGEQSMFLFFWISPSTGDSKFHHPACSMNCYQLPSGKLT